MIVKYFHAEAGGYKDDLKNFNLDDRHTIKDESEFLRKFNQFEREDST